MDSTEAYKNKIGDRLSRRLLHAAQDGEITQDQLKEISQYILANIDNAKTNSELYQFLEETTTKYPVLSDVLTVENVEQGEARKGEVIQKAENLIDNNKLDEALSVVSKANDNMTQGGNTSGS